MGAECGICKGTLGAIDYEAKSDAKHPLSFVIDEIIPISKAVWHGYDRREDAVKDWSNLQAAHWICNARKSNKTNYTISKPYQARLTILDGDW